LVSQQTGAVWVKGSLDSLRDFLTDYPRWVNPAFAPLPVQALSSDHYRVGLPTMGALGFNLTPEIDLCFFTVDAMTQGMRGKHPQPNGIYQLDLTGRFVLTPQPERVHLAWTVNLEVLLITPPFLDVLPPSLVTRVGGTTLATVSKLLGDRLLAQLLAEYG